MDETNKCDVLDHAPLIIVGSVQGDSACKLLILKVLIQMTAFELHERFFDVFIL